MDEGRYELEAQPHDYNLPAPYLRRIWLDSSRVTDPAAYPFCLPFLLNDFELSFDLA
jgi:hypothetical protein